MVKARSVLQKGKKTLHDYSLQVVENNSYTGTAMHVASNVTGHSTFVSASKRASKHIDGIH